MVQPRRPQPGEPVPRVIPVVLIAATAVSILSTDLYAPSLPHLPAYFGATPEAVQQTMTLNLAGFALGLLVHGPLADRYGRRPVMIAGFVGFTLACLAAALAPTLPVLIAARFAQGALGSAEMVLGLVVIRDLYDDRRAVRVMAYYGMTVMIVPTFGPVAGGWVHVAFGWHANFVILTVLGAVVVALIVRLLPETGTPDPHAARPLRVVRGYTTLLAHPRFMGYSLLILLVTGAVYAFLTDGPFVLIERHGVPTEFFGLYQGAIAGAAAAGCLCGERLSHYLRAEGLVAVSTAISVAGGLALLGVVLAGPETAMTITVAIAVYTFGLGMFWTAAPLRALSVAPGGRGQAAAMVSAVEMGGGGLAALVVSLMYDGTARPMAMTIAAFCVAGALAYVTIRPWRRADMAEAEAAAPEDA